MHSDCTMLVEAYKAAIDEYRFQVQLNWERNRFFLVSSMTGVSAAIALFKFIDSFLASILIPTLFGLSSVLAALGLSALRVGKKYYRRTLDHLSDIVELINYENLMRNSNYVPIPEFITTRGMQSRSLGMEGHKDPARKTVSRGTFSAFLVYFFQLIFSLSIIGMVLSFLDMWFRHDIWNKLVIIAASIVEFVAAVT